MPIHADRCRPFLSSAGSVTRALSALAITGPTEGIDSRRGPSSLALFSLRSMLSSAAISVLIVSICRTRIIRAARAVTGRRLSLSSRTIAASSANPSMPLAAKGCPSCPDGKELSREHDLGSQVMKLEIEAGDNSEIPAPAAQGPKQVGILRRIRANDFSVRSNDLGRDEVVDSQSKSSSEIS